MKYICLQIKEKERIQISTYNTIACVCGFIHRNLPSHTTLSKVAFAASTIIAFQSSNKTTRAILAATAAVNAFFAFCPSSTPGPAVTEVRAPEPTNLGNPENSNTV